jgi:hypothetical protein
MCCDADVSEIHTDLTASLFRVKCNYPTHNTTRRHNPEDLYLHKTLYQFSFLFELCLFKVRRNV